MTTLLLSNPPGRNKRGQFTKGRKRSTAKRRRSTTRKRRRSTASTTARRRTTRSNPPARRRRRSTARKAMSLRELLPQTAGGVAGYLITDWGTTKVINMLPPDVSRRIPAQAGPLVKAGVAIGLGAVARARPMPTSIKRAAPIIVAGGLISAGLDAWEMLKPRLMSGYSNPLMSGYSNPLMSGYNPQQLPAGQGSQAWQHEVDVIEV